MTNWINESDAIVDFNRKSWPKRRFATKERLIDWRIKQNPFFTEIKNGLVSKKEGKVIGQIIPIFSQIVLSGDKIDCVWGSDYFVDPDFRQTMAGMIILKSMLKSYVHFAVGMSEVSLKLHKVLGEKKIGSRYDSMAICAGRAKSQYEHLEFGKFLELFDTELYTTFENFDAPYFERTSAFYSWAFKFANHKKIRVLMDNDTCDFVVFYNSKFRGLPTVRIVDYSPSLNNETDKFLDMIKYHGQTNLNPLVFYSGNSDLFKNSLIKTTRRHDVYSNFKTFPTQKGDAPGLHLTALDSDRFIGNFL